MTKPTGRRRPGRPYCEAFPVLNVHDVVRAVAAKRVYQSWYDEDGLLVGFASVQGMTRDQAIFSFRFYGTRNIEQRMGTLEVGLRWSQRGAYWNKPSFVCPWCGNDVTRLYYVRGDWACKKSHDLLGIVQRLDKVNKAIYFKEMNKDKLKPRSNDGLDSAKTTKLRHKYGAAISLLRFEDRTELPWNLQFRCYGKWLKPGEVSEEPDLGAVGYGWSRGMTGQMPGLVLPEPPAGKLMTGTVSEWSKAHLDALKANPAAPPAAQEKPNVSGIMPWFGSDPARLPGETVGMFLTRTDGYSKRDSG